MDNSNHILNKLTAIESLLEATRKTKPLTLVEAVKFLDLSRSHLYKLTSERIIPHFKLNVKKIYFDKSELVLWLKLKPTRTLEKRKKKWQAILSLGKDQYET
jgi:predicted DNA-binding transcriptional regulator AlpA